MPCMKPTLIALLLSTPALGATISDVRQTFISDCITRGSAKGDDRAKEFCTCTFNVLEDRLTLAEYREVERHVADQRPAEKLPQMQRVMPALSACKK